MKFYYCDICGNVEILSDNDKVPMCCGKEMANLEVQLVDTPNEKHTPVVTIDGNNVNVVMGSVLHPMEEAHHMVFVAMVTDKGNKVVHLDKTGEPKAKFTLQDGEKCEAVYAYCNIHGLFKNL